MMKKTIAILLAVLMVVSVSVLFVSAVDNGTKVTVTIADKDGKLAVAAEEITVTDTDNDGKLTVNDVLYTAHEMFFEGGAAQGYATKNTQYGLALDKLWGYANYPNFGYTVNNVPVETDLNEIVKANDYVAAYALTDTKTWKDRYSYFDAYKAEVKDTASLELTYTKIEYDKDYKPVVEPVVGAEITVDGAPTGVLTDEEGKATYSFDKDGDFLVSATAPEGQVLVPPVCKAKVTFFDDGFEDDPLVDESTGIAIEPNEGTVLPEGARLVVRRMAVTVDEVNAIENFSGKFDITLVDKDDNPIQPNGSVTLKMPCKDPNGKIYRLEGEGDNKQYVDMNAVFDKDYLLAQVDHFSVYYLSETSATNDPTTVVPDNDPTDAPTEAPTLAPTEAPTTAPTDPATKDSSTKDSSSTSDSTAKTGDNTHLWLWIMISALCLCGIIGSVVIYKKHYAKQ